MVFIQNNHTPIFMVKLLDFNCVRNVFKRPIVYMFFLFTFVWIFTTKRSMFCIKLSCNIDDLKS